MSHQNPTTDPRPDDLAAVVPLRPLEDRSPQPAQPARLWREALGDEIRRQRMRRKDRLKDTAERAGISPQYLSEVERGMKDPSSEILEAVAGALGIAALELVRSTVGRSVVLSRGSFTGATRPSNSPNSPTLSGGMNPVLLAA